jgi:methylated-DNA-[protein]-cysteine S-methyltransferase
VIEVLEIDTPIGRIRLAVRDERLCGVGFSNGWSGVERTLERRFGAIETRRVVDSAGTAAALRRYFAGELGAIDEIEVDSGGTEFQRAVWSALRQIPAGATASYRDIANAVGSANAVRAVGTANGANPVGIVIPCHRVVRSDGHLGGYGGGLRRKRWLLDHERRWARRRPVLPH